MADDYTVVSEQGWGQRLGGSIKGILVGLLMIVGAVGLLFWGEGRAVKRAKLLDQGASSVVTVDATAPSPTQEGQLVHFTGNTDAFEPLQDPTFGVSSDDLKLVRSVEMYQWKETSSTKTEKKTGGGTRKETTYSYEKTWDDDWIDSSRFERTQGHENPSSMPYGSETFTADPIVIGDWILSREFVSKLDRREPLQLSDSDRDTASQLAGQAFASSDGGLYLGSDPANPAVGDVRIGFFTVSRAEVSVVGQQSSGSLVPFQGKVGGSIAFLAYGPKTAEAMFESAKAGNATLTWILRVVGFALVYAGFGTVLRPLSVGADVLPFLGNLVEKGIGLVAFVLAAIVATITIALGWLFYRPLLGLLLLAIAIALIVWLAKKASQNPDIDGKWDGKGTGQAPPPPPPASPPPPPPR